MIVTRGMGIGPVIGAIVAAGFGLSAPEAPPPVIPPVIEQVVVSSAWPRYGRFKIGPEDHYDEDEELEIAILVATIMRAM